MEECLRLSKLHFANYKNELETKDGKVIESCEEWLLEAKAMAERAASNYTVTNGQCYLYKPSMPVSVYDK